MKRKVTLIASNCEAFPSGSEVWGHQENGELMTLAGYEVEVIIYSLQRVQVQTALGYKFTISTADYSRLVAS